MSSFGTSFVIVNDVCQPLPAVKFAEGAAVHHATIKRGFDEYVVFSNPQTNQVYIEKVENNRAKFNLVQITDDSEWQDLTSFCIAAGLMDITGPKKHAS
jgi:hypothetical protein